MVIMNFIEESNETQSPAELVGLFCHSILQYGYSKFCSFSLRGLQPDVYANPGEKAHYNSEFLEAYEQNRLLEVDPVFKLFAHTQQPFTWHQVKALPLSKKQQDVMDMRTSTGSASGISMPVHSADIHMVGMSLSSEFADARDDRNAVAEIYAIANQFHLCRSVMKINERLALPQIRLSPREAQVLRWCSSGKSNNVIATILNISEKTVEFHMRSVFRKLNVNNRTSAVLEATKLRLIASPTSAAAAL